MQKIPLGQRQDILISPLGLGTVKFGRNQGVRYPSSFSLPSDQEVANLLSLAKDSGINLLDTAPAYGRSEERLGKCLKKQRHDWIICTKVGETFIGGESFFDFSASKIAESIERSLQRLKTDYLDIVLLHSHGLDSEIIDRDQGLSTLEKYREKGLIRAFGISSKTVEGGMRAIDLADVVMVCYNLADTSNKPVIDYAAKKKKAIFIKKGFASGHFSNVNSDDPVKTSLQWIFSQRGITSLILGTISPFHLQENIATFLNLHPLTI